MPATVIRCAATVPGPIVPRRDGDVRACRGEFAVGLDGIEPQPERVGDRVQRRTEVRPDVVDAVVLEGGGLATEIHDVEQDSG